MDPNNYVSAGPNGTYIAVVNGKQVGGSGMSQSEAEQAYNANGGPTGSSASSSTPAATTSGGTTYNTPNGPKTIAQMKAELLPPPPAGAGYNGPQDDASIIATYNSTASGAGATTTTPTVASASQAILDAIGTGNTQTFDEAVREYNATLANQQQQFNATQAQQNNQFEQSQYSNLAQNLLSTGASLRGPSDWYQFENYTNGGKDLMQSLFGNQPMAAFQAPAGTNPGPETISTLMSQLGFTQSPISATATSVGAAPATTGGAPGQYNTVNGWKTTDQMLAELKVAGWGPAQSGPRPDDATIANQYASTTGNPVTAYVAPATTPAAATPAAAPAAPAAATPAAPSNTGSAMLAAPGTTGTGAPAAPIAATGTGTADTGTTAPAVPSTPAGYQVNPAVWDSLGSVGQALVQSAIGASGGDYNTWLEQLNASRPAGTAPGASTTQFASPAGAY